ncbi:unnamed protein product, partial [marine sediment metagenome]
MANKVEFTAKNVKVFSSWLKKFSSIDKSLLLEIDESDSRFVAKSYNEERSVVKLSTIKFDVAGFTVKSSKDPKRIKVGIYNIVRLMKIMDQFKEEEFSFTVNWGEIKDGESVEYAGINLILKNKNLKITVDCISLNVFKYISDDLFQTVISALDNPVAKFDLNVENIETTNQLSVLDDDEYKFLEFKNAANVYVSGKTFDLLLRENPNEWDGEENTITIYKEQFTNVDVED